MGDCIRGDYTEDDQKPDRDLGRSVTPGFRNAGYADPARSFGLPSVRMDVAPRAASVASATDFGEGTTAAKLLAPCAYADLGVGEEDFLRPLAPGRVRALFERIGTPMSDIEFAAIWNRAASHGRYSPAGYVCLQEFRDALNAVIAGRDAGEEPAWFGEALRDLDARAAAGGE